MVRILLIIMCFNLYSQQYNINVRVLDTNEIPIVGAIIKIEKSNLGAETDVSGNGKIINLEKKELTLVASYIGYLPEKLNLYLPLLKDTSIVFHLKINPIYTTDTVSIIVRRIGDEKEIINLEKNNWTISYFDSTITFKQIFFTITNNGWAIAYKHGFSHRIGNQAATLISHTTNGGLNWSEPVLAQAPVYSIYFLTLDIGYISSIGMYLKTTDGGKSWVKYPMKVEEYNLTDIYFKNEDEGYIYGNYLANDYDVFYTKKAIFVTNDGGKTWEKKYYSDEQYKRYFPQRNKFKFSNITFSLSNSVLYKFSETDNNYKALYPPGLGQVFFINENIGYAISPKGQYIFKTTTGGE